MFAAEGAVFPTPVYTACTQTDINTHVVSVRRAAGQ